jgi:hypothetical protein
MDNRVNAEGRLMKAFIKTLVFVASIAGLCIAARGFAQTNTPNAESFLPKGNVTDALCVLIERDPVLDDYVRRIREAREKNPEWFLEYSKKYERPTHVPLPYHENFGVRKEEYEHFSQPMNQYREVKRKEIKIRRSSQNGRPQFDFVGDDLLLTQVVLNADGTVKTLTDVLPKMEFMDQQIATLPPGPYRGAYFRTADPKVIASKRRESLVIGELKEKNSGIIQYSVNTPGQVKMIYIEFQK